MKSFLSSLYLLLLNNVVSHIPIWNFRKFFYLMAGMKIGKGSRILMGAKIQGPNGISIGDHTYINSCCHLDGRGGLSIGNNVNISNYSIIISASHDMKSSSFAYRTGEVYISDYCWIGTHAIILDRSTLEEGVVLGAGSVLKGSTEKMSVYSGVPAKFVKERNLSGYYDISWKPWFC